VLLLLPDVIKFTQDVQTAVTFRTPPPHNTVATSHPWCLYNSSTSAPNFPAVSQTAVFTAGAGSLSHVNFTATSYTLVLVYLSLPTTAILFMRGRDNFKTLFTMLTEGTSWDTSP